MINGKTSTAFSGMSLPPINPGEAVQQDQIRDLSRLAFGSPRLLVEEEIARQLC